MFEIGQTVNAVASDWMWDNPMVVVEGYHLCSCGCGSEHVITCQGKSGERYEDYDCAWDDEDVYESDGDLLSDYLYESPKAEG